MASSTNFKINVGANIDNAQVNLRQLNREFVDLLKTLGKTPEEVKEFSKLSRELLKTGQVTGEVDEETRRLLKTYGELAAVAQSRQLLRILPHKQIERQILEVEKAFNTLKASGTLSQVEIAQAAMVTQRRIAELKERTTGVTAALSAAKGELAGLAVAGGGLGWAVKQSIDFESAIADVAKVSDLADAALARFAGEIQGLSRTIPMAATDLAKLAAAGGQLGIASDQLTRFTTLGAKMSTAFGMTADAAGQSIAKLMNIFNLSIGQIEATGDAVNTLGNNTAATERDILEVMNRIGGIANQFGLSANQAAALSAAMLSLGKTPEVASTGINALLSKLQTANVASAEFKQALRGIGIDAAQLAADITANPQAALENFLKTLQVLDKQSRAEVLTKLFGTEYQDDIAAVVNGLGQLQKAFGLVSDSSKTAGSMQREFETRAKTAEAQLQLLKNAGVEVATDLGNLFLPAVKAVAGGLASGTHAVADFVKTFPLISTLVTSLAEVTMAAGALKLALAACRVAMAGFTGDAVAGIGAMNTSLMTSVKAVGLLRSAFSVLAAGVIGWDVGTYLSENFEAVRKSGVFMTETLVKGQEELRYAWEKTKAVFSDDTIEKATERHKKRLAEIDAIFKSEYEAVKETAWKAKDQAVQASQQVADASVKMTADATGAMQKTVEAASQKIEAAAGKATAGMSAIQEMQKHLKSLEGQGETVGDIAGKAIQAILKPDFDFSKFSETTSKLADMRNASVDAARAFDRDLVGAFQSLNAVDLSTIQGKIEVAAAMAGGPIEKYKFLLDAVLPASLAKLGVDIEKFKSGMTTAEKEVVDAFNLVSSQAGVTSGQITAAFDAVLQKVDSLQAIDRIREILLALGRDGKAGPEQIADAMARLDAKAKEAKDAIASLKEESTAVGDAFKLLGVQTAASLDRTAAEAKAAFETIRSSGKASTGELKQAWESYAQKALAAAKAHGGYQEEEIKRTVEAQGAVLGLGRELEKTGTAGERAGKQISDGMRSAASSTRSASSEVENLKKSLEAQSAAIREYWNPNTTADRKAELQKQMITAGVSWDSLEALQARSEEGGKSSSQAPSNLGFSYQIPFWDLMSDTMRKRVKEAIRLGNQPGMQETAKDEERKLRRQMSASVSGLERMKEQLKNAGADVDDQMGRMLEGYVSGAKKNLSLDALSELSSAVESWKSRSEQAAKEKTEKEKTSEGREPFRTAKPSEAKEPAKVEVKQPEKVTVQVEKPVEIRAEPEASQPIVEIKSPAQPQPQPQAQPQARMQPQPQPPEGREQPPAPPERRREEKPDDRPLKTLEQIAASLSDIQKDVSTMAGIAMRSGGTSSSRMSSKDMTHSMLTTLAEAASRS